jgi:phosphate transport system permease protein
MMGRTQIRRRMWRRTVGGFFAAAAAGSLMLGLLVLLVLITNTVLQSRKIVAMNATADAGISLSLRSLQVDVGTQRLYFPYVTLAQVNKGSLAEGLGLARGDALIAVAGAPVELPDEVWKAIERAPGGRRIPLTVTWVPKARALLGSLRAVPVPERPGEFHVALSKLTPGSPAERAGLQAGDVLLAADELPIVGTRQAWEAIAIASRRAAGPIALSIERDGQVIRIELDARRMGEIPLTRDIWGAYWAFITELNEPRYPERAGLISAIVGSLYILLVMALFAFPLGIGAAIYLEEYAGRGALTEIIQVLIANLAGIPSVVYGIIGLEILARALGLGRSILAGGLTLGLLVLPIMIIAAREALRTVPPWVREAAYGVGATQWQVIRHHVLPYALPGVFTGMILALSRALGEAAPLILLGAFLYVTYVPSSLWDSFTVIPLQIFDWATKPQDGFAEISAAAIVVLLAILLLLNGTAIVLRDRFQQRW